MDAPLLGSGRDADVYALADERVLRRYRRGIAVEHEVRVMRHLAAVGFPVPVVHAASGSDIVMSRVEGTSMMLLLRDRPELVTELGALHRRLHEIPAPAWLGTGQVLHLDFHPDNVIVTAAGPVVIDWRNTAAGPPALDTATTYVLMAAVDVPFLLDLRDELLAAFRASCGADPVERLAEAVASRADDGNITAEEKARMRSLLS